MADWSLSSLSNLYWDSSQDSLCFGKCERLFHSDNWAMAAPWLKNYSKTQDMYFYFLAQWQVKRCSFSESYIAHRLWAKRVLAYGNISGGNISGGNISGYRFPVNSYVAGLCDEGIHVLWDEGQIMKVIYLKKQPKNSGIYSLVSFTKPHEMPWKRKHSSHCFFSQHFFTWGWDQQFMVFDLKLEEESDFLYVVAIQAGQKFQPNDWRKQIFVIFNDCQDML